MVWKEKRVGDTAITETSERSFITPLNIMAPLGLVFSQLNMASRQLGRWHAHRNILEPRVSSSITNHQSPICSLLLRSEHVAQNAFNHRAVENGSKSWFGWDLLQEHTHGLNGRNIKPRERLWRFGSLIHFNHGRIGFSWCLHEMRGISLDWMESFVVIEKCTTSRLQSHSLAIWT